MSDLSLGLGQLLHEQNPSTREVARFEVGDVPFTLHEMPGDKLGIHQVFNGTQRRKAWLLGHLTDHPWIEIRPGVEWDRDDRATILRHALEALQEVKQASPDAV